VAVLESVRGICTSVKKRPRNSPTKEQKRPIEIGIPVAAVLDRCARQIRSQLLRQIVTRTTKAMNQWWLPIHIY